MIVLVKHITNIDGTEAFEVDGTQYTDFNTLVSSLSAQCCEKDIFDSLQNLISTSDIQSRENSRLLTEVIEAINSQDLSGLNLDFEVPSNITPQLYFWDNGGVDEIVTAYAKLDSSGDFLEWVVLSGVAPTNLNDPTALTPNSSLSTQNTTTPLTYQWDNGGTLETVNAFASLDEDGNFIQWVITNGTPPPDVTDITSLIKYEVPTEEVVYYEHSFSMFPNTYSTLQTLEIRTDSSPGVDAEQQTISFRSEYVNISKYEVLLNWFSRKRDFVDVQHRFIPNGGALVITFLSKKQFVYVSTLSEANGVETFTITPVEQAPRTVVSTDINLLDAPDEVYDFEPEIIDVTGSQLTGTLTAGGSLTPSFVGLNIRNLNIVLIPSDNQTLPEAFLTLNFVGGGSIQQAIKGGGIEVEMQSNEPPIEDIVLQSSTGVDLIYAVNYTS